MSGRGTLARRLVFAGAAISLAAWAVGERRPVDDAAEEKPLIPDDVAVAAARGLDPPRSRRPFRSRLATSLVFATIFCAGAALTAGAGNEVARMDATPLAEATTTAAEAEAPAPPAEESTPAPAPEPTTAVTEPTPAPEPSAAEAPAAEPEAAAPAPEAPAETAAAAPDPSDVTTAPPAAAAPVVEVAAAAAPSSRARVAAKRTAPHATLRAKAPAERKAPAALQIPFSALAFDPAAWLNDNPASPTGASAVALSAHYLGVPYVWGGAAPGTGFDCSGLTMFVYNQLGVRLPHYAAAQFAMFPKLSAVDLEPGDLVFFEPRFDGPGHVAVYAGGDQIIEAPHTGALVRYSSLSAAAAALGFMGAVRPYGTEQQLAAPHAMQVSLFARPE